MPTADDILSAFHGRLSRRSMVGGMVAALAAGHVVAPGGRAATTPPVPATWRTWLLDAGDELRPAPPGEPTSAELDELRRLQDERTVDVARLVEAWASGPALLPWTALVLDLIAIHQPNPVRAGRALALLHAAFADAVVATWDAKAAYPRPAPSSLDAALVPLGAAVETPSAFPSEHAAVAAAAAAVLAYLFPTEPADRFAELADEAARSRLCAATNVRSDVEAGAAIGRAVGARAVARGQADGSDAVWDGTGRPAGDGYWQPTPPTYVQRPVEPLAGTWQPWVLGSGDAYRPTPPPTWGSPAWQAEVGAVQEAVATRTPEQEAAVRFWAGSPGTVTPAGLWTEIARDLVVRDGLDLPHAARVLALTTVAMADGFICCWDAKYAYWSARPITADPTLDVLIPTPPFPSYTSGHSTISTAAATVLGHLFPADAVDLADRAIEAKNSRLWAGIHFPIDNEMGATGGGMVGRLVVVRARADGAEGED
ncbi:MAG TPA: phosphatase PAP2 family protein [Thermomicrobiales bacterium]|jgi:membrane-associated phospholipid phosphatase